MNNKEIGGDFYDTNYFMTMRERYESGAHGSRIRNTLKLLPPKLIMNKKVLDAGCGYGYFANEFQKRGADVTGIDYSPDGIKMAKSLYPNVKFYVDDILKTKFKDNSFDMVCIIDIIEHIRDQEGVMREIKRLLKPGGIIVISTNNDRKLWQNKNVERFVRFSERFSKEGIAFRKIKAVKYNKSYHSSHHSLIDYDELEKLVVHNGFSIMKHVVYFFVGVPLRDMFTRLLPKRIRGNHQTIIAKCN